jgi:hypothetical protein
MPSDRSFNRTDDSLFLAYLFIFFAAWTMFIAAWTMYVLLVYPHVRVRGDTVLRLHPVKG